MKPQRKLVVGQTAAHKRFHPLGLAIKSRLPLIKTRVSGLSASIQIELCRLVWSRRPFNKAVTRRSLPVLHSVFRGSIYPCRLLLEDGVKPRNVPFLHKLYLERSARRPSIFLDRALVQLQFCPSCNVYLQSHHNDISLSESRKFILLWKVLMQFGLFCSSECRSGDGIGADSIKGAVLKVGLALGGVILLMFKHVGAILLSPIFERELFTHVWLMRCNCIIIFPVTYTVARVSERDLR